MANTEATAFFRATYTRDGHKKQRWNRKWLDGFLKLRGRSAVLIAEDGSEVAVARLPDKIEIEPDGDELSFFGGTILVCVDCQCGAQDVPGAAATQAATAVAAPKQAASSMPSHPAAAAAPAARLRAGENVQHASNRLPRQAGLRPSGGARPGAKKFMPPRVERPLPESHPQPDLQGHSVSMAADPTSWKAQVGHQQRQLHMRQGQRPGRPLPGYQATQEPPAAMHRGCAGGAALPAAAGERTAEDILSLLTGSAPAAKTAKEASPAKKARLQPQLDSLGQGSGEDPPAHSRWAAYEDGSTSSAAQAPGLGTAAQHGAQAGAHHSRWASTGSEGGNDEGGGSHAGLRPVGVPGAVMLPRNRWGPVADVDSASICTGQGHPRGPAAAQPAGSLPAARPALAASGQGQGQGVGQLGDEGGMRGWAGASCWETEGAEEQDGRSGLGSSSGITQRTSQAAGCNNCPAEQPTGAPAAKHSSRWATGQQQQRQQQQQQLPQQQQQQQQLQGWLQSPTAHPGDPHQLMPMQQAPAQRARLAGTQPPLITHQAPTQQQLQLLQGRQPGNTVSRFAPPLVGVASQEPQQQPLRVQHGRPGFQQPRPAQTTAFSSAGSLVSRGQPTVGLGGLGTSDPAQLCFAASTSSRPARQVIVPDSFDSEQEYGAAWKRVIMEELNLKLAEVAQAYCQASARLQSSGKPGAGPGGALEGCLRQFGVHYHSCELFIWKNLPNKKQTGTKQKRWNRGKGKGADADEDTEQDDDEQAGQKPESLYLIIKSGRGKSTDYRKDDLWVISNTPQFQAGFAPGQVGDKARAPWVAVARSLWHGPNQDGKFEVELLSPKPPNMGRSQMVYAIKGPEATTELRMVELLQSLSAQSLPLLPHILGIPADDGKLAAALPVSAALAEAAAPGHTAIAGAAVTAAAAGRAAAAATTPQRPAVTSPVGSMAGSDSPCYSPTDSESACEGARKAGREAETAGLALAGSAATGEGKTPSRSSPSKSSWKDSREADPAVDVPPPNKRARRAKGGKGGAGSPAEGADTMTATAAGGDSRSALEADAEALIARFKLNPEQADVVQNVAAWCLPDNDQGRVQQDAASGPGRPPPICLIHGPFGSGKSTLLVSILHLLLAQRSRQGPGGGPLVGCRVLVAAHTNVAVDRVLLGLLESGCTDFLRVGPLRRINRQLLRQSLHCSESKAHASAAAELREMLKESSDPHETAVLQAELELAEKGAERQKKRLLKTIPVVGVTCCSALLSALDGQTFDVVVLDECSQMVEPLSLVPLIRAKCRYLVAAGDPLQLPPVIAAPAQVTPAPGQPPASAHGLLRPLFVRLAALGHTPHLLRRQYRCHPDLAAVPNQQFYGGRLLDGCGAADRPSLLPGLPNLVFLDVRGSEQYNPGSRSAANPQEAAAVVAVVQQLLQAGVEPGKCGVICFFRAQAALIRSMLDTQLPALVAPQRQQESRKPGGANDSAEGSCQSEEAEGSEGGKEGQSQGPGSIQVATVDSFQGAEKDVILLSTTVTRPGSFAADSCRLNVALTRAKNNLVLVGCAPALQQSAPAFAALLRKCRSVPGAFGPQGRLPLPPAAPTLAGAAAGGVMRAPVVDVAAAAGPRLGQHGQVGGSYPQIQSWQQQEQQQQQHNQQSQVVWPTGVACEADDWEQGDGICDEEWEALEAAQRRPEVQQRQERQQQRQQQQAAAEQKEQQDKEAQRPQQEEEFAATRVGDVQLPLAEAAPAGSPRGGDCKSRPGTAGMSPGCEPAADDSDEEMPDFELA